MHIESSPILYQSVKVPAMQNGGDQPARVVLAQEGSLYVVYFCDHDDRRILWLAPVTGSRDRAIEKAVEFGRFYSVDKLRKLGFSVFDALQKDNR